MGKFDLSMIVKDQVSTLVDARTGNYRVTDFSALYGVPAFMSAVTVFFGWRMKGAPELLAGLTILTGLVFGLIVWVFQLRITVRDSDRYVPGDRLSMLLDQLFTNVLYCALAGGITVVTTIVAVSIVDSSGPMSVGWTAVLVFASTHFLLSLAMVLKRVRSAYYDATR